MLDGPSVVAAFQDCGITHVVWLPDSVLGTWDQALRTSAHLQLIRVCREGEAIAIAGGLLLGGKRPIVLIQCTGLFEAGDSLRNIIHDMNLPLFLVVGVRGWQARQSGAGVDNCPVFSEPILRAWHVPYVSLTQASTAADLAAAYRQAWAEKRPGAALLLE